MKVDLQLGQQLGSLWGDLPRPWGFESSYKVMFMNTAAEKQAH